MNISRKIMLTCLAMIAFAGNSLLCRMALERTSIDAASFTSIRLLSGALVLWLIVLVGSGEKAGKGNWLSAFALFAYAAGFSFAYISLPTGTGALLLFGSVQATMIGFGIWKGERLINFQLAGLVIAFSGMVGLMLPGLSAPPFFGAVLMLGAGISWGVYSLRGKGVGDPTRVTAGNFIRAVPFALFLSSLMLKENQLDLAGIGYAFSSGAIASGIGYAIWYIILPEFKSITAATIQLSVPVIAALGGILFLGEQISLRLILASFAILGGIALVIMGKREKNDRR